MLLITVFLWQKLFLSVKNNSAALLLVPQPLSIYNRSTLKSASPYLDYPCLENFFSKKVQKIRYG